MMLQVPVRRMTFVKDTTEYRKSPAWRALHGGRRNTWATEAMMQHFAACELRHASYSIAANLEVPGSALV
jgi:hypothetical protein